MNRPPFNPDDEAARLERILADGDGARASDDPAIRNLARLYDDFEAETPPPPEAQAEEADHELDRRLAHLTPLARPARRAAWRSRPALALAAVLLLSVGIFSGRQLSQQLSGDAQREVLRGESVATPTLTVSPTDHGVALGWPLAEDADGAVLVLLDTRMAEVRRIVTRGVTRHLLESADLTGATYVKLELMREGDVVATLVPVALP